MDTVTNMLVAWLACAAACYIVLFLYSILKKSMFYWKERGVPHMKPLPVFGNYFPVFTLKKNVFDIYKEVYDKFPKERMVGLYEFTTPTLVLRDPELIEEVLIKNFTAFPDHGPFIFEPSSSLHLGLFNMYGERWRALRNKLLSTFATGRMKCIFSGMVECSEELVRQSPERLDKQSFSDFAVDSFLRSLFGAKLMPEGEAEFRELVCSMFQAPVHRYLQQLYLTFFPKLADFFNAKYMPEFMDNYFRSIVNTLLNARENMKHVRKDYVDILLQLRNSKKLNVFSRGSNTKLEKVFDVTNHLVLCQAFFFFFAGMETTSLVMLYTGFHLAHTPAAQEKARDEVRRLKEKHGGITFDAVREMKYMEQCIQEALRLNPSLVFLMRISEKDTELGGVNITKGTRIIIPNFCLQMDPKYFPNPEQFDPDRFHENSPRNKFAHLPFSEGPRVCAGKKFSLIEIATLSAHLLDNFELTLNPETKLPLEYHPRTVFLTPKNPVVIKLKKLL